MEAVRSALVYSALQLHRGYFCPTGACGAAAESQSGCSTHDTHAPHERSRSPFFPTDRMSVSVVLKPCVESMSAATNSAALKSEQRGTNKKGTRNGKKTSTVPTPCESRHICRLRHHSPHLHNFNECFYCSSAVVGPYQTVQYGGHTANKPPPHPQWANLHNGHHAMARLT